jgi:hypothetical protein
LNELKLLLDPSKKHLKIGGYDARLDWSRATILIGSNDVLSDESMQTRLPQIIIREASYEAKLNVASKTIKQTAEVYKKSFDVKLYQRLLSTCKSRIEQLIEFDTENFPGVRFLESSSENMVHFVASGLLQGKPKTMDQFRNYLEIQYTQAKGRPLPGDTIPPVTALTDD